MFLCIAQRRDHVFVAEEIGNVLIVVVEIALKAKQDFGKTGRGRRLTESETQWDGKTDEQDDLETMACGLAPHLHLPPIRDSMITITTRITGYT
jgi:hypothetical protein